MKLSNAVRLSLALAFLEGARSQVSEWGQCGGIGYAGSTTCVSGTVCVEQNDYYSQCLPGTASSTSASVTSSTTVKPTTTTSSATSTASAPASTGFVKTSGQMFTLNGSPFTVVGENSYWVGLMGYSTSDMNKAFSDIAGTGATVVRTWGFNEVTSPNGIYYQSWSGSTPTINTGATGLQNFDNAVAAAKANGIRLIVALTNNWSDYGGMDVYTHQILGSSAPHDDFYTNDQVIAAYKNYIKTFVGRYVNEPTIMAWELANEPRCSGSSGTTSGTCTTTTITNWASSISAYIKSLDSNHLVAIGDEGFFANTTLSDTYPYQGTEGIDFQKNIQISTLDFGTAHMYPESWGQSANETLWGVQWIQDHANVQKSANKPVILEEFGATTNQVQIYTQWFNAIDSSGLTGDLIWQAGSTLTNGQTPNDGYAVYPGTDVYNLVTSSAAALKARG